MNYRRPGFPVHGILQTRVLEWVAISFSRGSSRPRDRTQVRCITGRFFYHLSHQRSPYFMCAAAAKSLQSCPTLCGPIDGSPTGSPVPGILQARILEWVAISFSNAWKWKVKVKLFSLVRLCVTPWTVAHQAPPSMGFHSIINLYVLLATGLPRWLSGKESTCQYRKHSNVKTKPRQPRQFLIRVTQHPTLVVW